jgi:hypothetical protein
LEGLGVDIANLPPRLRAGIEARHEGMNPMRRFLAEQDYWNPASNRVASTLEVGEVDNVDSLPQNNAFVAGAELL